MNPVEDLAIDIVVERLNEMLNASPRAMMMLVSRRVTCSESMSKTYAQVEEEDDRSTVGMLGILNGLFEPIQKGPKKGYGQITAVYRGHVLVRFTRTDRLI